MRPAITFIRCLPLFAAAFFLAACPKDGGPIFTSSGGSSEPSETALSDIDHPVADSDVSPSVKAAFAAAAGRVRGLDAAAIDESLGVTGSVIIASMPGDSFAAFEMVAVKVAKYHPAKAEDPVEKVSAYVYFANGVNQREILKMDLAYDMAAETPRFTKGLWRTVYSERPRAEAFLLPAAAGEALQQHGASYVTIYRAAVANALPVSRPGDLPKGEQDYIIAVFMKDRIAPGADFAVGVTRAPSEDNGGYIKSTEYLAYSGWTVALIPGRFDLNHPEPLHAVVSLAPKGGGADNMDVIGVYAVAPHRGS